MTRSGNTLFLILSVLVLVSCRTGTMDPLEYTRYVENPENGFVKEKETNGIVFKLLYKPIDYIIVNELRKSSITQSEHARLKRELEGMTYFNLMVSKRINGRKSDVVAQNKALESHLQFSPRSRIYLKHGTSKIPCTMYHFQTTRGLNPHSTMVVGFEFEQDIEKDLKFIYESDDKLGNETVVFAIGNDDLAALPKLKLK